MARVLLDGSTDGEPDEMACGRCGRRTWFDATLPYVKQTVAFATGHECLASVGIDGT